MILTRQLVMKGVVVFWTISTIQDEQSAAKFHYIKTVSGKAVAQSRYSFAADTSDLTRWGHRRSLSKVNCSFRVVSIY